jgi:hypothetical protein
MTRLTRRGERVAGLGVVAAIIAAHYLAAALYWLVGA